MRTVIPWLILVVLVPGAGAADSLRLPMFPEPALVPENGPPEEISSIRLLRELHRAGLHGFDQLEASDADYGLLRQRALGVLTGWLDAACSALDYDLRQARTGSYDGAVFARLLRVASSLGVLQGQARPLALPIGVIACQRTKAWGALPGDQANDVYVIFATDGGMFIYDPPTRQLVALADFPNKGNISEIRF